MKPKHVVIAALLGVFLGICFMVYILPSLFLSGRGLTTVDKTQEYSPPVIANILLFVLPVEDLPMVCANKDAHGCTVMDTPNSIYIYISDSYEDRKGLMEHEFNHVIYGPLHKEDR